MIPMIQGKMKYITKGESFSKYSFVNPSRITMNPQVSKKYILFLFKESVEGINNTVQISFYYFLSAEIEEDPLDSWGLAKGKNGMY